MRDIRPVCGVRCAPWVELMVGWTCVVTFVSGLHSLLDPYGGQPLCNLLFIVFLSDWLCVAPLCVQ